MSIIAPIVSQHAEEAAFLWLLRDVAVSAPHYSLADLAELDSRVEAHIEGLRVAGDAGWSCCVEGLQQEESGEVFAAAVIALEGEDPRRIEQVCAAVEATPETARGFISALGWTAPDKLGGKVAGLLESDSPLWRRIGIAACAVHRVDCGKHLSQALDDPDPTLRARALRAAGETARRDLLPDLRGQMRSEDPTCGFWAAWSAVLLGDRGEGVSALQSIAVSDPPLGPRALQVVPRVLPPANAGDWLKVLAQYPERRRELVIGCGVSGDPVYIPWLITRMEEAPDLARVAGEALSLITGLDIADEDLEQDAPEGFEAGPTEHPEDEDVALDPDEDLPWPNPGPIKAWWDTNSARFHAGTRYLSGEPISEAQCQRVLETGSQRQRRAATLELALLRPDAPLFETRAPGFRQQQGLVQEAMKHPGAPEA
ncbi:TIGR02270 family protein [Candidatus Thiosymbion oneisti]|uniref:TIGR02270 family protein n=1 Tax=Candidatus Thiosymbion oneisti TaxID=589554 RepID=UPI0015B4F777|nr:TIGR02270 family protein [Candidatus Thiosymbion oneisti]